MYYVTDVFGKVHKIEGCYLDDDYSISSGILVFLSVAYDEVVVVFQEYSHYRFKEAE